jgi:hypothetical protein
MIINHMSFYIIKTSYKATLKAYAFLAQALETAKISLTIKSSQSSKKVKLTLHLKPTVQSC